MQLLKIRYYAKVDQLKAINDDLALERLKPISLCEGEKIGVINANLMALKVRGDLGAIHKMINQNAANIGWYVNPDMSTAHGDVLEVICDKSDLNKVGVILRSNGAIGADNI